MSKPVIDLDKLCGINRENSPSVSTTASPEPVTEKSDNKAFYKRFSDTIRNKIAPVAKKIAVTSILTAATLSPTEKAASYPNTSANTKAELEYAEQRREIVLGRIAKIRSSDLSNEIVANLTNLQADITAAKKNGQRNSAVKNLFTSVFTHNALSGEDHYCVAGAIYAHRQCDDLIIRRILPDPEKTHEDFARESNSSYCSHPNVYCPDLQQFFRDNYGDNYAGPKDTNFKKVVQNLEAGDILTLYQESNSSSGHHCVTCIGPVENGRVQVKSLNDEGTYPVSVSRISGAANVMKQYRETYIREMANELPAERFMPVTIGKKLQIDDQLKAPVAPPLPAGHTSDKQDKPALSYTQLYNKYA